MDAPSLAICSGIFVPRDRDTSTGAQSNWTLQTAARNPFPIPYLFPEDAIIFISIFVVTCQLPAAERLRLAPAINCLYVIHHQQAPVRSQILHYLGKA